MRRAVFPGSFDPITLGHYDIIKRGVTLFDEVIVAIGINADKKYMFSLKERMDFIKESFKDEPKVKVVTYTGLTIDFCQKNNVDFTKILCEKILTEIKNSKRSIKLIFTF